MSARSAFFHFFSFSKNFGLPLASNEREQAIEEAPAMRTLSDLDLLGADPSALDELLDKERRGYLAHLMEEFSDKDRRFVELYYGQGLLPEEVAAAMRISVKTVYSKKNKLRTRLEAIAKQDPAAP